MMQQPTGLDTLLPQQVAPVAAPAKYDYNAPDRLARRDAYFASPRFRQDN